jgi:hypothetical protein
MEHQEQEMGFKRSLRLLEVILSYLYTFLEVEREVKRSEYSKYSYKWGMYHVKLSVTNRVSIAIQKVLLTKYSNDNSSVQKGKQRDTVTTIVTVLGVWPKLSGQQSENETRVSGARVQVSIQ